MTLLQMENNKSSSDTIPILRLGFRPFFLLAACSAVVLMLTWIYMLHGGPAATVYGAVGWHAHEMLFGFSMAVIAGFLLTAEKNWTGLQTLQGFWLGVLALLWLAGRIAPWLPIPDWLIALIDLSFLPLLAAVLLRPLIKSSQWQHLIFILILLLMFVANVLFHLGYLFPGWHTGKAGIQLAWMTILLLITLMGGRVIPFFIERGTGALTKVRIYRSLDRAGFITLLCWMLASMIMPQSDLFVAALACLAGVLQLWRWWGWHLRALWRVPMLWILYLGYAWIPLGLFLYAYAVYQDMPVSLALHAFTAGTIGMVTLGMMARVALGHTGREIRAGAVVIAAFVLVTLAALVRVFGLMLADAIHIAEHAGLLKIAGLLWAMGFTLFIIAYYRVLTSARIDQRPG